MAQLSSNHIIELTRSLWAEFLGLSLEELPGGDGPEWNGERVYSVTVDIEGAWNGTVVLSCAEPAARAATAFMFGIPVVEADDPQIRDALGELVNIMGGNLKALVPVPTHLSLPRHHLNRSEPYRPRIGVLEDAAGFRCAGALVLVEVYGQTESNTAASSPLGTRP